MRAVAGAGGERRTLRIMRRWKRAGSGSGGRRRCRRDRACAVKVSAPSASGVAAAARRGARREVGGGGRGGVTLAGAGAFRCMDPLFLRFNNLFTKTSWVDTEIISEFLEIPPFFPITRIPVTHNCLPLV